MDPITKAYRTGVILAAIMFTVGTGIGLYFGEQKATASVRFEFLPCVKWG